MEAEAGRGHRLARATQLPSGRAGFELGAGPQGLLWGEVSSLAAGRLLAFARWLLTKTINILYLAGHVGQIEAVFGWENAVPISLGQGLMAPAAAPGARGL